MIRAVEKLILEDTSSQDAVNFAQRRISILGLYQMVGLCEELGIDRASALAGTGIDASLLENPTAHISAQQEISFLNNIRSRIDLPHWGLLAGQRYRLSALGLLGAAVIHNGSGKEAVDFFKRYIHLSYTYFALKTQQLGNEFGLMLLDQYALGELRRYFIDRDFAFTVTAQRDVFPHQNFLKAVYLAYPEPPVRAPYDAFFKVPVYFGAEHSMLIWDVNFLEQKLPQANPLMLKFLEGQCDDLARRVQKSGGWVDEVRRILVSRQPMPKLDEVAEHFHMSPRTLRRRLADKNVQFQHLVAQAKQQQAFHLLRDTDFSIDAIAGKLGYSESAAFIHAFKNWTDMTPSQYRSRSREA